MGKRKQAKPPGGGFRLWLSLGALGGTAMLLGIALLPRSTSVPQGRLAAAPVAAPVPVKPKAPLRDPLADLIERESDSPAVQASEHADAQVAPPHPVPPPAPVQQAALPVPSTEPPAWRRNAVPSVPDGNGAMIAIVIDDMGLDRARAAEVVALPGPLTLSYMTYAENLGTQTSAARAHGHEIMLHVPMEPLAKRVDPGPNALVTGLSTDEIRRRLEWGLGRIDGIAGINNHMGSRFTAWPEGMRPVLEVVKEHGLFFLDSRTTPHSVGIEIATEEGVPHAARDVFLDDAMTNPAVAHELAVTEAVARRNGVAIAIGHPHDATIEELRAWLPTVESRGFKLVPVSAIVSRNVAAEVRLVKGAG